MRGLMIAALLLGGLSGPAVAECFSGLGCSDVDRFRQADLRTMRCSDLWYVRNRIFDENGYCFRTARGRANFDNSDCWEADQAQVKMNAVERANVDAIVRAERALGCR
ncbi:YARHG domain-containing protein [Afifella pfennigii]|uniref:YARHG domain-containing protein n=1 Tax=Afifella pfennigii TaxID=209897 RepID=UPI00146FB84A|nr:YARHG domain-containing protein [Afifella pfennigii]